jgi:hypothetical protein
MIDVVSDNAEDCIRSAANRAWPSRRASPALRIQFVGLNRRFDSAMGIESRLDPRRGVPGGQSRPSIMSKHRGEGTAMAPGPPLACRSPGPAGRIPPGMRGIHGHLSRWSRSRRSEGDSLLTRSVQDVSIVALSAAGPCLTGPWL